MDILGIASLALLMVGLTGFGWMYVEGQNRILTQQVVADQLTKLHRRD